MLVDAKGILLSITQAPDYDRPYYLKAAFESSKRPKEIFVRLLLDQAEIFRGRIRSNQGTLSVLGGSKTISMKDVDMMEKLVQDTFKDVK
jgi:hypothetical protein